MSALADGRSWPNGFSMTDAPPPIVLLRHQSGSAECRDHGAEQAIGDGEIEEMVAARALRLVEAGKMIAQAGEGLRLREVALHVSHAVGQPSPGILIDVIGLELAAPAGDECVHHVEQAFLPLRRGPVAAIDANQLKTLRAGGRLAVTRL